MDVTIDKIPDAELANIGWNLREQQDFISQQLQAIRNEFARRRQIKPAQQ